MKKSLLVLISISSLRVLAACGGHPPATHFSVTAPATAATGTAVSFIVTALDASNRSTTNYSGTAHFTSTDGQAVLPANSMLANGTGTFSATLKTAGSQTITATDTVTASITGTSNSISVSAAAATHFSVTAPATATAGTAVSFTVTALDASNHPTTNYSGTAHFTSTDGQAVLPANSMLTNGMGSFLATLKTPGSQTITATDTVTASIAGTSNSINVSAAVATHFSVTAPATAATGTAVSFIVTALDVSNHPTTNYSGTAHFTSTDGQAVLPANSMLANGTGTFSATLKTAGSQTITATDTVTASITGTSNSISVSAAAATHFSVTAPATATAGTAVSFTVTALDASNHPTTNYSGTAHFTSTDGQAVLPANSMLTNGMGSFLATLKTPGSQTITATDTVTASIAGTSNSINVSAAVATHFSVTAPATATTGTAVSFTVTAFDVSNHPTTNYSGTAHFTSTDGQAVLPANSMLANGTGTFSATLKTPGSQTITVTDTVTASITGTSNSINVSSAVVATHFSVTAPGVVTIGTAVGFTVTALNASNDVVTSYSGTVHFTSTDDKAVLPANSTLTNGVGKFSAMLTDGRWTITATDTLNASITGTSLPISVVVPPTATHFSVTAPTTATVGRAVSFTVTALDASNSQVNGYTGTVHLTSGDPKAVLPVNSALANGLGSFSATLNTAGDQIIAAVDSETGSVKGTSSSIQVSTSASDFTSTGSMVIAREDHTATPLYDGKVLIVGGVHWTKVEGCARCSPQLSALASAELYDPATGKFTLTGNMSVPRVFHTATLLGNGKVIVAGGDNRNDTIYSTAELYDPATGLFTLIGNMMTTERSGHTATLLENGKVLVAGGASVGGSSSSAEVFDPTTEEFTPTGSMSVGRFFFAATLLNGGRVLVAGGVCDDNGRTGAGTSSAELFDPATNTFALTGSMSVERSAHAATLLTSGAVLVTGGATSNGVAATAELFDPVTGTFALTGNMLSPREFHTVTRLDDGKVLVTGGFEGNGTLSSAELFDPASGSFTLAGNMETERSEHTATLSTNGQVLISGGINNQNGGLSSLATAELFP